MYVETSLKIEEKNCMLIAMAAAGWQNYLFFIVSVFFQIFFKSWYLQSQKTKRRLLTGRRWEAGGPNEMGLRSLNHTADMWQLVNSTQQVTLERAGTVGWGVTVLSVDRLCPSSLRLANSLDKTHLPGSQKDWGKEGTDPEVSQRVERVEITKSEKLGFLMMARRVINSHGTLSSGFVFSLLQIWVCFGGEVSNNLVSVFPSYRARSRDPKFYQKQHFYSVKLPRQHQLLMTSCDWGDTDWF